MVAVGNSKVWRKGKCARQKALSGFRVEEGRIKIGVKENIWATCTRIGQESNALR